MKNDIKRDILDKITDINTELCSLSSELSRYQNVMIELKKAVNDREDLKKDLTRQMRAMSEIKNLKEKCGLFREFCKINGLKDGDYYSAVEYLEYCGGLTLAQTAEIMRKYEPDFNL